MAKEMPTETKEIIAAILEGRLISRIETTELTAKLLHLINKIHANCGASIDGQMINLTLNDLVKIIHKEYPTFTFTEIEIAFQNGWQNLYGEFYGLNNKTYLGWVKSYSDSKSRLEAKKAVQNAKNSQGVKPEPTESQKDQMICEALKLIFNRIKAGQEVPQIPSVFYDFLSRKLVLVYTTERKLAFQKQAIDQITAEKNEIKSKESIRRTEIESYLNKLMPDSHDVIARAKSIAVMTYFNELIEIDQDFTIEI